MARKRKSFTELKPSTKLNYAYRAYKQLMSDSKKLKHKLQNKEDSQYLFTDTPQIIHDKYIRLREDIRNYNKYDKREQEDIIKTFNQFQEYRKGVDYIQSTVADQRADDYVENINEVLNVTLNSNDSGVITAKIFESMTPEQINNFFASKYYIKMSNFYSGGALDEWILEHDMTPQALRLVDYVDLECKDINLHNILGEDYDKYVTTIKRYREGDK